MFPRSANHPFQLVVKDSWIRSIQPALGIECLEDSGSDDLLPHEIRLSFQTRGHKSPTILPILDVRHVVLRPSFRITQHVIIVENLSKGTFVSSVLIVRV